MSEEQSTAKEIGLLNDSKELPGDLNRQTDDIQLEKESFPELECPRAIEPGALFQSEKEELSLQLDRYADQELIALILPLPFEDR